MSELEGLLSCLRGAGVKLWVQDGRLRYQSPPDALTPELRARIGANRVELLAFLDRPDTRARESVIRQVPRNAALPLSFAQQRLWFLHQLDPGSAAYNIPSALHLKGPLHLNVFAGALTRIMARHESLRTTFPTRAGRPLQFIHPPRAPTLILVDLDLLTASNQVAAVARLIRTEAARPFSLERGPLLRISLLRVSPEDHFLLLTMHHIISDAWSLGILIRELVEFYGNGLLGKPAPPPPLPFQYADFAAWQRDRMEQGGLAAQLDYWKMKLAGAPPLLEIPTDHPRPPDQTFAGGRFSFLLAAELSAALKGMSRSEGLSLFMLLQAVFAILLSRYSGQDDIVMGTPVANRNRKSLEALIGFFVNTVALRSNLSGEPDFHELAAKARTTALAAFENQDVPFERVVEVLRPERNRGYTPIFQVVFLLQNTPYERPHLPGLKLGPVEVENRTTKFDLTLSVIEAGEMLSGSLEYNTDLFEHDTIVRMAGHWRRLLEAVIHEPASPVSKHSMLGPAERRGLLASLSASAGKADERLEAPHRVFEHWALRVPDAIALECEGRHLGYAKLSREADRLAARLRRDIASEGTEHYLGLLCEPSGELALGMLAILKAGAAYVPLDPGLPDERLKLIVEDAGLDIILAQPILSHRMASRHCRIVPLVPQFGRNLEHRDSIPVPVALDQPIYVIYTSGSTGRPKGVPVSHRNLARLFRATRQWFRFGRKDVWTLFHAFAFDFSVWEFWGALLYGGRLVIVPRWTARAPDAFAELLTRRRVTILNQTPTAFGHLIATRQLGRDAPLPRVVIFGGEALNPRSLMAWHQSLGERAPALVNMYGITETTVHVTYQALTSEDLFRGSRAIGEPIPDLSIPLLDIRLEPVPPGLPGQLCVGGAGLARGYLGRPDLSALRFVPHPFAGLAGERLYLSGDRARRLGGGELVYLGRIDHQIKIRGYRIEPGEIEATLRAVPGVAEALVLVREERAGEPALAAYITTGGKDPRGADAARLAAAARDSLRSRLPAYMVPATIVPLGAWPLTPNGKLDRAALPRPGTRESADEVAPRDAVEEVLAGLWAQVLDLPRVGVHANFFELGGHSLLGAQIIARSREAFQVEIGLRPLFEAPTVAQLARRIRALRGGGARLALPPIGSARAFKKPITEEGQAARPLSFAQRRLWFLDRLEGPTSTYNMPAAMRLRGPLDMAALERALAAMIRRNDILRTRFTTVAGQPLWVVQPYSPPRLVLLDMSGLERARREAALSARVAAEALTPFDLSRGPLLRYQLARLAGEENVVLVTTHHIVSDGWSLGLFVAQLTRLYRDYQARRPESLPEPVLQYADYAAWQEHCLQLPLMERQLAYWRDKLGGALPLMEMPTDQARPALPRMRGAAREARVDAKMRDALQNLAQRAGATAFMVLLAAFKLLLSRYCGQTETVVGTPVAGRHHAGTERLLGCFLNTLVLRTNHAGAGSFLALLARVRAGCLAAFEHQDIPFEKLLEALRVPRDRTRTPLFQIFFNMLQLPTHAADSTGLSMEPLAMPDIGAKFDITLYANPRPEGIHLSLHYQADLFSAERMRLFLDQYIQLLAQIARDPELPPGEYSLITDEMRSWLPDPTLLQNENWRGTVHDLFAQRTGATPDRIALAGEGRFLSYHRLNRTSDVLAGYLRAAGLQKGETAAICAAREPGLVPALLAVMKAGAAFLMLDPAYPGARLIEYLELSQARFRLRIGKGDPLPATLAAWSGEAFPPARGMRICLDPASHLPADLQGKRVPPLAPLPMLGPDDAACIAFTSGSSGKPKGIRGRHGSLTHFMPWWNRNFQLSENDRFSLLSGLAHDPLQRDIFTPLTLGAMLCIPPQREIEAGRLPRWMLAHRLSVVHLTPAMGRILTAGEEPPPITGLRRIFLVGEALTAADVRRLRRAAPAAEVINLYGSTETQRCVAFFPVPREIAATESGPGSNPMIMPLGRGIEDVQVLVLNGANQLAGVGELGEIHVRSPHLALGYLGDEALTDARFIANPFSEVDGDRMYRTGDLGRYRPDGNLIFAGRADRQVKLRGFRIEPGEIEALLETHPSVDQAVVLVREAGSGQPLLAAFIVEKTAPSTSAGKDFKPVRPREFLRDRLPNYMVPTLFIPLERLPLTANGKLDRALLERYPLPRTAAARLQRSDTSVRPRDNLELRLLHIWEELLGISPIGVRDNFFDLGGHSLLAVQLMAMVQREFGRELYLASLFQGPTVERFAALLRREPGTETESALVAIQPMGEKPPFFCVHPGGGTVLCYVDLARRLGSDQPFYGLQSRVIYGREPRNRIEEMAGEYIVAMRGLQPQGPYRLGGWSLGGLIAFEMARQLLLAGETVEPLVLIDPYPLRLTQWPEIEDEVVMMADLLRELGATFGLELSLPAEEMRAMAPARRIDHIVNLGKEHGILPEEVGAEQLHRLWRVFRANHQANHRYLPGSYPGRITLFRAGQPSPGKTLDLARVWGERARQGIVVHTTPGHHIDMVSEPHVEVLADRLRVCLEAASAAQTLIRSEPVLEGHPGEKTGRSAS